MAKDRNVPLGLGLLGGNAKVYNTIAEMQQDSKLKAGKVVELLGYYQAGDGAGHKRKIESEDDGSGVQLANGLWANIVHNGEIRITWLGITNSSSSADSNKSIINKAISSIVNLKKLVFDTDFYCHEIEITKDIEIAGNLDYKAGEYRYLRNENNTKNTIIFKISGNNTLLKSFKIVGGLNGIFSEEVDFNPKIEKLGVTYCSFAGINHTPNEKYNQSGNSNSFYFSYIDDLYLKNNKYGMLLDHSKVLLRQNWSNSNSIENSNIKDNDVGIYIIGMDRMECWQINNTDLSRNQVFTGENITLEEYKNKMQNNQYGAIILKNCKGCDIELNSTYIEFSGELCTLTNRDSQIKNEIKTNGNNIYDNTYEYQGIIGVFDISGFEAVFPKTKTYSAINLINCSNSKVICSNCWLTLCSSVIKINGGSGNGFVTKNANTMYSSYDYCDNVANIFDFDTNVKLLEISLETSKKKNVSDYNYLPPTNIPVICKIKDLYLSRPTTLKSKYNINNLDDNIDFYTFIGGVEGFCFLEKTIINIADNKNGYTSHKVNSALLRSADGNVELVFDSSKKMVIDSGIGEIVLRGFKLTFKGSGEVSLGFNNIKYISCVFDFSEFNGNLIFTGGKQKFQDCSVIGGTYNITARCILENLTTSNFFWNDFRTSIPDKIISYPQGHGFNLNGINYVRKGSQWVRASDGTTQALSEVMALDTSYYSRLMEQEGIINDYDNYRLALSEYNKQEEIEFEHSMKAYNDYVTTETDEDNIMTYEEFETKYGNNVMMNLSLVERLEEPQIPDSVVKFMEKYLGTTPTPKVETKPKIFNFDEVDKLNDTLKKL